MSGALPRNSPSGSTNNLETGGGTPAKKTKPMDNMSATSFFAQLVRQQHGPIPKEKSPSPPPVIMDSENANSSDLQIVSEVVTINDDDSLGSSSNSMSKRTDTAQQELGVVDGAQPKIDSVDGDAIASTAESSIEISDGVSKDTLQLPPTDIPGGSVIPSLMQLPFPPGMDKNNVNVLTTTMGIIPGLSNATQALYGSLQGATPSKKNKVMSITKDLPMPPGIFFLTSLLCEGQIEDPVRCIFEYLYLASNNLFFSFVCT